MNYGKKKASQKQKKITSKSTMQGKRIGVRLFKAFLLCLIVVGVTGVVGVGVFAKKIIDDSPEPPPRLHVSLNPAQIVRLSPSRRFQRIYSMPLSQSRTNVFMNTTESTCRESSVQE